MKLPFILFGKSFLSSWVASETFEIQKKIAVIQQSVCLHIPFNEHSKGYLLFKKDLEVQILQVQKVLPWATFL